MTDFYPGWGNEYEDGYNMTSEEWDDMHSDYNERDDWSYPDE